MMFAPLESIKEFIELMNSGETIMWVLFVLNLMLWYGLGYRYAALTRGTAGSVRHLLDKHEINGEKQPIRGMLDYAVIDAISAKNEANGILQDCRDYVYDALFPYYMEIGKYSILIRTIALLAPLVGLLGTVTGMIETFDALQTSSMYSQSNSISGGISKALLATELGLMVAVPGLILGKILDRKEERLELDFEQVTKILSTKDSHEM
ncbi:MAG: MotA/TolQ/ExbB proton channel family protein [Sulfuricurvum sp.]|nr:MotA/TolQ/ExbB proton channel family protein [Sulfuricurvum sp.]